VTLWTHKMLLVLQLCYQYQIVLKHTTTFSGHRHKIMDESSSDVKCWKRINLNKQCCTCELKRSPNIHPPGVSSLPRNYVYDLWKYNCKWHFWASLAVWTVYTPFYTSPPPSSPSTTLIPCYYLTTCTEKETDKKLAIHPADKLTPVYNNIISCETIG